MTTVSHLFVRVAIGFGSLAGLGLTMGGCIAAPVDGVETGTGESAVVTPQGETGCNTDYQCCVSGSNETITDSNSCYTDLLDAGCKASAHPTRQISSDSVYLSTVCPKPFSVPHACVGAPYDAFTSDPTPCYSVPAGWVTVMFDPNCGSGGCKPLY
jgi:hypothetical protein